MDEHTIWNLIDIYFKENPQALVRHHIDSYNQFVEEDISQILKDMNPLKIRLNMDEELGDFRTKCDLYFGGKDGSRVYYGKPIIHDPNNSHYMFPNEARLRNMTYAMTIHYDVDVEYTRILEENDAPTEVDENGFILFSYKGSDEKNINKANPQMTPSEMAKLRQGAEASINGNKQIVKMRLEKVYMGKLPIMTQSNVCILNNSSRLLRHSLGECKNDVGGYFIIDGKEKVIVPQEAFGDNMINVYKSHDEQYSYIVDMKSISENLSKPKRTLSIRILAPTATIPYNNIGVFIPNAGELPIPLFVVFRALGIISDKEIISFCTFSQPDSIPSSFLPYFDACIHDASTIVTQQEAIQYIALTVKGRSIWRAYQVLADYFLPHVGELNYLEKAYHLGYLVNRLLMVAIGLEPQTDRDSYKSKRVTLIGPLMKNLFSDYYQMQLKYINLQIETIHVYNQKAYHDIGVLIQEKYDDIFQKRIVEDGIRKAFKGNWGAHSHTKIIGVIQDLNRLSHNSMMNHLRKTNLPMDSSMKIVAPRVLHGSQWGLIDPIDTPDGGNVGLHKHLALLTHITTSMSREPLIQWITKHTPIILLSQCHPARIGKFTKVFVNGYWVGGIADPHTFVNTLKINRRHGLIPITISIMFDYSRNSVVLSTDGGRLCRPIFYWDELTKEFIFQNPEKWKKLQGQLNATTTGTKIWHSIISGFHPKKVESFNPYKNIFYEWNELYDLEKSHMKMNKALMEYLDTQETEGSLIAMHYHDASNSKKKFTHCELHPSTTYGMMCNLINFVEHNPASRNSFSCGQSKQACSLYSTNYQLRMDKSALILNQGQIPLVKSRYLEYINHEENPYGENAIVAIMCYTGYNVEDAILINEGSLQRGLFRTTYFNTYEAREEKETKHQIVVKEKIFSKNLFQDNVVAKRIDPDFDYSYLDESGLIVENTEVNDKTILIGQTERLDHHGNVRDVSILPKKGQLGFVDKAFMTEGEEGERIAKVRIRHERIPAMGDKFASRAGQKGTIGMIIPEADMPYTKDGIRPDMIINPHALPSRMTIGQMIECIIGKACAMKGAFGDCTAFSDNKNKIGLFGKMLAKHQFHSSGDEILYNGMNGKQIEASIFIGPTYYMRLKHMVKDKINYRARGPITKLTRQPVSGRANDGGLRIGEMERDAVISHGMSTFLRESMMERADKYKLAICNHTGLVSIYNPNRDIMISPGADGPIQYGGSLHHDGQLEVRQMTKYGRSFSIIEIPYAMKLLIQELQAIQVQMHIITEDNIQQISNMDFSHNMKLHLDNDMNNLKLSIANIQKAFKRSKKDVLKQGNNVEELLQKQEDKNKQKVEIEAEEKNEDDDVIQPEYNNEENVEEDQKKQPRTPSFAPPDIPNVRLKENEIIRESNKYPGRFYIYNQSTGERIWVTEDGQRMDEIDLNTQAGGADFSNEDSIDAFTVGTKVLLRNNVSNPKQVWTITRAIPASDSYTIKVDKLEDNMLESESLKVVSSTDIYLYNDAYNRRENDEFYEPETPPPSFVPPANSMGEQGYNMTVPNGHPTIEFKPVIKVFGHGNDNSHTEDSSPVNPEDNVSVNNNDDSTNEATDENPNAISNPIDFSKQVLIKKMDK